MYLNPFFRSSASEALKWNIFDKIRQKSKEQSSPIKIKLELDRDDAFEYEKLQSKKYDNKAYKVILAKTVEKVQKRRY